MVMLFQPELLSATPSVSSIEQALDLAWHISPIRIFAKVQPLICGKWQSHRHTLYVFQDREYQVIDSYCHFETICWFMFPIQIGWRISPIFRAILLLCLKPTIFADKNLWKSHGHPVKFKTATWKSRKTTINPIKTYIKNTINPRILNIIP